MLNEHQMRASIRLTRYLYYKAIIDCGYEARFNALFSNRISIANSDEVKSEKVSNRYLQLILTCSDKTLKVILDADEAGICRRAGKTLEAIKIELFERVMFERAMNEEDSCKDKTIDIS